MWMVGLCLNHLKIWPGIVPAMKSLSSTAVRSVYSSEKIKLKGHILQETCISVSHLTPELKLHLITPDCRLWQSTNSTPFNDDPFWGFYWPGGQSLSRLLLDNGSLVKNRRVLDFGSGSGACGLNAKRMGAKFVTFNDIDEVALIAVEQNAFLNQVMVDRLTSKNLIGDDCNEVDVILVGDMLYDSEFAAEILNWFLKLSKKGKKILIGDPGRFALSSHPMKNFFKCIGKYRLQPHTIIENSGFSDAFVWELRDS